MSTSYDIKDEQDVADSLRDMGVLLEELRTRQNMYDEQMDDKALAFRCSQLAEYAADLERWFRRNEDGKE